MFRRWRKHRKTIRDIRKHLEEGPYQDYVLQNGLVYKYLHGCELIIVPKVMQNEIIKNAHKKGHFATKRTEEKIKQEFFIPILHTKVKKCIANCVKCILINKKFGKRERYLHPLDKRDMPLHTYHIDHLGPLETTPKSYKYIFAVIDAFTKFVWLHSAKTFQDSKEELKSWNYKKIFLEIQVGLSLIEVPFLLWSNLKIIVTKKTLNTLKSQ